VSRVKTETSMRLERQQIINTALDLLNKVGIDQLTTRKLAERLGVQQPALYWHFKNKSALLDAMNETMRARGHTYLAPQLGDDWRTFLIENARSFRRSLLAYRDGARVHAGSDAAQKDLPSAEGELAFLKQSGFEIVLASQTLLAIGRYTIGCVLEEQAELADPPDREAQETALQGYPLLRGAMKGQRESGHEQSFEAGIRLIVDGLATQLPNGARGRTKPAAQQLSLFGSI
jgi:TetR/AcrR family tetracycline transcriptional repressor